MLLKITTISLFAVLLAMYSCHAQDSLISENILILRKRKSSKRVYYIKKSPIVYKNNDTIQVGLINEIDFIRVEIFFRMFILPTAKIYSLGKFLTPFAMFFIDVSIP